MTFRSFNPAWYDKWQWLHWDVASEKVFCFTCMVAYKQKKLIAPKGDGAFIQKGFQNWKDATVAFRNHECSGTHKDAVHQMVTIPSTNKDIVVCLSSAMAEERKKNQACFLKILSSIHFLARQGLALRGDGCGEIEGNFTQLLKLRASDESSVYLNAWLKRKSDKYTSHDIQNEMLGVMALNLLRNIADNVRTSKFTIMIDETTDVSTTEQVVIVLRWVGSDLDVHEDFIGLHSTDSIASNSLVSIIRDVLLRLNLNIENCLGQCYDGAANMRGCRNGVAKQTADMEPRTIFLHCYGHALNLACQDTIRSIKVIRDALDTTFELSKLLKYSSKWKSSYIKLKDELAPTESGFRTLCPTRWTVRADSLASVRKNYSVLQSSLDKFSEMAARDMEMSAKVNGVGAQFEKFDFVYGVMLGELVLRLADNLSNTLQQKTLSAAEGNRAAMLTCDIFVLSFI